MADDAEERAAATAPSNGVGGEETTPPPDPNAAATNGGEITLATGPEVAATTATHGREATHEPGADEHWGLHAYAARYSGRTLVARLLFIARLCEVEATEREALRMAVEEVTGGKDTLSYAEVLYMIGGRFGPPYDQGWVDAISEDFSQAKHHIEAELSYLKESQNTNEIMNSYVKLGGLYYDHGYLPESFKSYIQMEEYLTAPQDLLNMCMNAILISIELQKYDRVFHYANMVKTSQVVLGPTNIAKLQAVTGLALLAKKQYKLAAFEFVETGPELERSCSDVIAPEDVALYGALCALASFDSAEMKINVMDSVKFGHFLQLVPQVRQLVHDFYHGHHSSCLKDLEDMKPSLLLDIYIADHLDTLILVISQKSGYVAFDSFQLDALIQTPLNVEAEEQPEREETGQQIAIVSNFMLPDQFNDETPLLASTHYKFLKSKELLLSIGKRSICWVSRHHAHALLINARLFVRDSIRDDEERFDGRMVVVSNEKFSILEVQYSSYTTTRKPLKETRLQDKEDSAIDRFQMKGDIWTRRRICLKNNNNYHLIQWRKTSGLRRGRVQQPEVAAAHNNTQVQQPEAAAQMENNAQLNETMKSLIEHLKDHTKVMTEGQKLMVELNCSLAEARRTAATTAMGSGGVAN